MLPSSLLFLPGDFLQVYKPLRTFIALVGLEIWSNGDLISVTPPAGANLNAFMSWRNSELMQRKNHDNAHLIRFEWHQAPNMNYTLKSSIFPKYSHHWCIRSLCIQSLRFLNNTCVTCMYSPIRLQMASRLTKCHFVSIFWKEQGSQFFLS